MQRPARGSHPLAVAATALVTTALATAALAGSATLAPGVDGDRTGSGARAAQELLRWSPPAGAALAFDHGFEFEFELTDLELRVFDRELEPEEFLPGLGVETLSAAGDLSLATVDRLLRLGPELPPKGPLEFVRAVGPLRLDGEPVAPLAEALRVRFLLDQGDWLRFRLDGDDDSEGELDPTLDLLAEDIGLRWTIADGEADADERWYAELTPQRLLDLCLPGIEIDALETLVTTLGNDRAMTPWLAAGLPLTFRELARESFLDLAFVGRERTDDGRSVGRVALEFDRTGTVDVTSIVRAEAGEGWNRGARQPAIEAEWELTLEGAGELLWDLEHHCLVQLVLDVDVDARLRIDFDASDYEEWPMTVHAEALWEGQFTRRTTGTLE